MAERHESALKATRQNAKHRLVNRRNLGKVKAAVRAQREALAKGNAEQAAKSAPGTQAALDRAVAKRVLHKNAAARRKSRLQKKLNKIAAGAAK